jgi:5-methyltetrahydropteroyltriglutamate--homocysteine methyltransferase
MADATQRERPPFRADMVGSLLRTEPLKEARERHARGEIGPDALRRVEDDEIRKIVARQEEIGLQSVTDGEFRRSWWHFDFYQELDGVERRLGEKTIKFKGIETRPDSIHVVGRVGWPGTHPMIEHFRFLKETAQAVPKMTLPSPSVLHYRGGRHAIAETVYDDYDQFFDDMGEAYAQAIRAFYDAGCRYLQLDDTAWSYLCDQEQREETRKRGDDPDDLKGRYARTINKAVSSRPDDMTITMHVCRGNFRSAWIAQGGYEPVAETIFGELDINGYFLEYDTDRAGGFEPLRFVPEGDKQVVLGLVTSKTGALEAKDDLKRRIDEAAKFVDLDQLCLSPQCGFASTEEGNILAEDEQWAKLARIVEVSREVWR